MPTPDRRDSVKKREFRIGIVGDIENREVPYDKGIDQGEHAHSQQNKDEGDGHAPGAGPIGVAGLEGQYGAGHAKD